MKIMVPSRESGIKKFYFISQQAEFADLQQWNRAKPAYSGADIRWIGLEELYDFHLLCYIRINYIWE